MILNISDDEYTKIDENKQIQEENNIFFENVKRTMRLRNIVKHRVDINGENTDSVNIEMFQRMRKKNALDYNKVLRKTTPPKYIKTNFRHRTLEKYKSLIGQYNNLGS